MSLNVVANNPSARNVCVGRLCWGDHVIEPYRIDGGEAVPKDGAQAAVCTSKADESAKQSKRRKDAAPRQNKRRKDAAPVSGAAAGVGRSAESIEGVVADPVPPGRRGFRLIIASDIIIEDAAIPLAWATVEHYLSEEQGATFAMTCVERPTLVMSAGIVSEEAVDTTLQAFVDGAAERGFEAGEAVAEVSRVASAQQEHEEDGERVRTFVFCRA
jgi:hypothetical protein